MSRRLEAISGPGLVVLFLTGTFSAIDWLMSLEPKWVSTIYGAMVITGEALATLAAMIVVVAFLSRYPPLSEAATSERLHDLGNLMLAFTMLWAYVAFSQFLIIWCGNLPEEIPWYLRRPRAAGSGWLWRLVVFHFFVPFFVLLFRESKRQTRLIVGCCNLHPGHALGRRGLAGYSGVDRDGEPAECRGFSFPWASRRRSPGRRNLALFFLVPTEAGPAGSAPRRDLLAGAEHAG